MVHVMLFCGATCASRCPKCAACHVIISWCNLCIPRCSKLSHSAAHCGLRATINLNRWIVPNGMKKYVAGIKPFPALTYRCVYRWKHQERVAGKPRHACHRCVLCFPKCLQYLSWTIVTPDIDRCLHSLYRMHCKTTPCRPR